MITGAIRGHNLSLLYCRVLVLRLVYKLSQSDKDNEVSFDVAQIQIKTEILLFQCLKFDDVTNLPEF